MRIFHESGIKTEGGGLLIVMGQGPGAWGIYAFVIYIYICVYIDIYASRYINYASRVSENQVNQVSSSLTLKTGQGLSLPILQPIRQWQFEAHKLEAWLIYIRLQMLQMITNSLQITYPLQMITSPLQMITNPLGSDSLSPIN